MTKCAYCSKDEPLPFTCRYCVQKFCRNHRLPEKHSCKGLTQEVWQSKKRNENRRKPPPYKRVYKILGVTKVLERRRPGGRAEGDHVEIDERLIAVTILLLIILLSALTRRI